MVRQREFPLLGRRAQLDTLRARGHGAPALAVSGPPGGGKSRLLAEAWPPGAPVLRLSAAGSCRPDLQVVERVAIAAVVIDDADRLRPEQLPTVAAVLEACAAPRVVTVTSGRSLRPSVAALVGHLDVLTLPPLPPTDMVALLDALVEAPIGQVDRRRLSALAAGWPGWLVGLVDQAAGRRQLTASPDGALRLSDDFDPAVAGAQLVHRVCAPLPSAARAALERLVLTGPLPLGLVRRVAEPRDLAALDAAGVVTVRPDDDVQVLDLIGAVVQQELTPARSGERARELLHRIGDDHPDAPYVLADWARRAADDDPRDRERWLPADGWLQAAWAADDRGDGETALRCAQIAHRLRPHDPATTLVLAELGSRRGDRRCLARLDALAADPSRSTDRARIGLSRAVGTLRGRGDPVRAAAIAEAVASAYLDVPAGQDAVAVAGLAHLLRGDARSARGALRHADRSGATARPSVVAVDRLLAAVGDRSAATAASASADPAALDGSPPAWIHPVPAVARSLTLAYGGQLAEAALLTQPDDVTVAGGWGELLAAHLAELRGDLTTSLAAACDALVQAQRGGPTVVRPAARIAIALAAGQAGRPRVARHQLDLLRAEGVGAQGWLDVHRARADAWHRAAAGDAGGAADTVLAAAGPALEQGLTLWGAIAALDAVRFGAAGPASRPLARAAASAPGLWTAALLDAAHALDGDDLDRGRRAGDGLLALGLRRSAAELWLLAAARHGASGPTGDVDRPATPSRRDPAERLRRRAGTILAELGPLTPRDRSAISPELTPREREVCGWVVEGATSAALAAELGLSCRTVENHVTRALAKTGADDRYELATLLSMAPRRAANDGVAAPHARPSGAEEPSRRIRNPVSRGADERPARVTRATARRRTPRPDPARV